VRPLALVLGVAALIALLYYVDEFSLGLILAAGYLFTPWALLAFGVNSLGSVARGIAILGVTVLSVWMYISIWNSESSTAGLGFLVLPFYQWLTIGVVLVVSARVARTQRSGRSASDRNA
jgi:hypothetical protein